MARCCSGACSTAREAGARFRGSRRRAGSPRAHGETLWLHLCRAAEGVNEWLQSELAIPEPTAELLTSNDTRPRAFREGTTLVATLRGINFNPGALPEDMVSMQLWCDGTRLVTLRRLPLQTPRETLALIDAGRGPDDAGSLGDIPDRTGGRADEPRDRRHEPRDRPARGSRLRLRGHRGAAVANFGHPPQLPCAAAPHGAAARRARGDQPRCARLVRTPRPPRNCRDHRAVAALPR